MESYMYDVCIADFLASLLVRVRTSGAGRGGRTTPPVFRFVHSCIPTITFTYPDV
jgi:hypothetical protein